MIDQKSISIRFNELFAVSLIALLPLTIFIGSSVMNLTVILLDLVFLFEIFKKKKLNFLKNNTFYFLIFLWFVLIANLIFISIDPSRSLLRTVGFFRFIIFIFALKYFFEINNSSYREKIFKIWTIFFIIVSIDLVYEFFIGQNLFGWKAELPGRLVGFFQDEMKIGHFYSAFILISLITVDKFLNSPLLNKKSKFLKISIFYTFVLFFFVISFLIGERANFVRILFFLTLFLVIFKKDYKIMFSILLVSIFIFFNIMSNNDRFKQRFWLTFIYPLINDPVEIMFTAPYGNHYKIALEIFDNHKAFGVGIRNYVIESRKDIYSKDASVHPHQVHFEFLSELGLSGYLIFFYFFIHSIFVGFKSFLTSKNFYQLAGILFVFASLLPFIPSGSFFTTYGAVLFWLNFALLMQNNKSN
jgi:hypothetical protein